MILNGLDYLLAGVLAINTLAGFRKGMIRALGGIAGVLVAIMFAGRSYKALAFWLQAQWDLQSVFAEWIVVRLPNWALPAVNTGSSPGMNDSVYSLSYHLLLALSFIIILLCIGVMGQLLVEVLHRCLKNTPLAGLDQMMGMAAGFIKSFIILTLLAGLIFPVSELGATMGWETAGRVYNLINNSQIAAGMLCLFKQLSAWLGFNA